MNKPTVFGTHKEEELSAINLLQEALAPQPVVVLPNSMRQITLDTDTCNKHVGCGLPQKQNDETARPIGYLSRNFNGAEKWNNNKQSKSLVEVWSVSILQSHLEVTSFRIRSDHDSPKWILNLTDSTGRHAWRNLHLSEQDFAVDHRAVVERQADNALSLLRTTSRTKRISMTTYLSSLWWSRKAASRTLK